MTNKDKYLKDNIKENDFADMCVYLTRYFDNKISMQKVAEFFKEQIKPTLTEDERVILRNIMFLTKIGKDRTSIYVATKENSIYRLGVFNHLFQFIKERRRI